MEKKKKPIWLNSVFTGTIIGLILPVISIFIFYCMTQSRNSFSNFIQYAIQIKILSRVISLCAIPNLGAFFVFMWLNYMFSARGIILATFIVTFGVLILKGFVV